MKTNIQIDKERALAIAETGGVVGWLDKRGDFHALDAKDITGIADDRRLIYQRVQRDLFVEQSTQQSIF